MDAIFIALALVAAVAARLGYKLGWNQCVSLYERRQVEAANKRAHEDRK